MSEPCLRFSLQEPEPLKRLDLLVVDLLAACGHHVTRSVARAWIDSGFVLVDGRCAKASAKPKHGQTLEVFPQAPPPTQALADASVQVNVLYEDDAVIVVDKPAGLVVHPARGHESGTLVNGLLARGSFDLSLGDGEDDDAKGRPGIVHRLDKDTSGVMVVARTVFAREFLKDLFARHDIEREYEAVVVGEAKDATYDTLHGRHPTDRLRFTTRVRGEGKRAATHVRVVERFGKLATRIRCRLETGRTHQIRVHMAECSGTPILGDQLYGRRPKDPLLAQLHESLGRQFLHARLLGFVHPTTGESLRFESELPTELAEVLERLEKMR